MSGHLGLHVNHVEFATRATRTGREFSPFYAANFRIMEHLRLATQRQAEAADGTDDEGGDEQVGDETDEEPRPNSRAPFLPGMKRPRSASPHSARAIRARRRRERLDGPASFSSPPPPSLPTYPPTSTPTCPPTAPPVSAPTPVLLSAPPTTSQHTQPSMAPPAFLSLLKTAPPLPSFATPPAAPNTHSSVSTSTSSPTSSPTDVDIPAPTVANSKKNRTKLKRKATRAAEAVSRSGKTAAEVASTVRRRATAVQETSIAVEDLPAQRGAYGANNAHWVGEKKPRTKDEMLSKGFRVVEYKEGVVVPIVDGSGRLVGSVTGSPKGQSYQDDAEEAFHVIRDEGLAATFTQKEKKHRRAHSPALATGISYGKGQKVPSVLLEHSHAAMIERIVGNRAVQRMCTFASASFGVWAPRVHAYYERHMEELDRLLPDTLRKFPRSVYAAFSINFGPQAWTFRHTDPHNCPFGWCAITALGRFDYRRGGHLILWDLKLLIEFPPGCTVHILSACLSHSNIPLGKGEERVSMTQYTSGALFRWIDNGGRTNEELQKEDPEHYARMEAKAESAWEEGYELLPTLDEILATDKYELVEHTY